MDEKYPSCQNNEILINRLMTKWILNYCTDELVKVVINFFDKTNVQGQDIKFN